MFQYLRSIALIAAIILDCGAAFAEVDRSSANHIMRGCRDFISSSLSNSQRGPLEQGYCAGVVDGLDFTGLGVCAPPSVTVSQAVRVVVKYIDDRPARLNENFKALAYEALQAAWPCKN
jgi:hypothetical protein